MTSPSEHTGAAWPPSAHTGVVRLAVATRRGIVLATVREQEAPRLCTSGVTVFASRLEYAFAPEGVTIAASHAIDVAVAVPTVSLDAVPKRVAEHVAGRYAAARALVAAGHPRQSLRPVGASVDHAPVWPAGFRGSITHGGDRVLAAVARADRVGAIGIDVERIIVPETIAEIRSSICTPAELGALARDAPSLSPAETLTVVFSAKESVYKALHPYVLRFFDFSEAHASALDVARGTLAIRLLADLGDRFVRGYELEVRFVVEAGYVTTSVELGPFGTR